MYQKMGVQIKNTKRIFFNELTTMGLIALIALLFMEASYGAACTSISRTNNSANAILTSTKYNTDHNTAYTAINNIIDASCTIGKASLTASEFAAPWDSFKDGCEVTRSDAATLNIAPCRLAVDGEWVNTVTNTTVTWGCTGCSAEVATSTYYVYAKDGSTGTTLTPLILTTAPTDSHGEDGSNNKVLARFFNNGSGDIDQYSIDQWTINKFIPQSTGWINAGAVTITATTTAPTKGTTSYDAAFWRRVGNSMEWVWHFNQTGAGSAGSGTYLHHLPSGFAMDTDVFRTNSASASNIDSGIGICYSAQSSTVTGFYGPIQPYDHNRFIVSREDNAGTHGAIGSGVFQLSNANQLRNCHMTIPIKGWGN